MSFSAQSYSFVRSHLLSSPVQATIQLPLAVPVWPSSVVIGMPCPAPVCPVGLHTTHFCTLPPPLGHIDKQLWPNQRDCLHPLEQPSRPADPPGRSSTHTCALGKTHLLVRWSHCEACLNPHSQSDLNSYSRNSAGIHLCLNLKYIAFVYFHLSCIHFSNLLQSFYWTQMINWLSLCW